LGVNGRKNGKTPFVSPQPVRLGHTDKQITQTVYRRVGETVKPTK
jgi:hypothetical protein